MARARDALRVCGRAKKSCAKERKLVETTSLHAEADELMAAAEEVLSDAEYRIFRRQLGRFFFERKFDE